MRQSKEGGGWECKVSNWRQADCQAGGSKRQLPPNANYKR